MTIDLPLTSREHAARYRAMGLWHDKTYVEFFAASAARAPDKLAIIERRRRWTYRQLAGAIDAVATNLLSLGFDPGDVVALQTWNSAEMVMLHLACNRIGLLYLPLHDSWREVEMKHLLARAGARAIVTPIDYRGFDHAAMIAGIRGELPRLEHHFTLGGSTQGSRDFAELLRAGSIDTAALDARRPDPDLPAHTMLSGGTTALSKISRFTCNDLMVMLENFTRNAEVTEADVIAGLAPAGTGATGYVFPILVPVLVGATAVILDRWADPAEAVELIREHRCTAAVGVPTQLTLMIPPLEAKQPSDFASFRVFYNAGAPLPYDTGLKIETLMDCVVQSMYGSTDGGVPSVTSVHDPREKRLRTVGRIVPGCECQFWDPEGNAVPPGESGEVVWRGADKCYGYLGDDEQTAKTFTADHFYKSGDLGRIDADGYLGITGRVKDMILRGGRNISPLTIEEKLIEHPSVVDVAVAAMPDPILGERACAFVLLREGKSLSFAEAVAFLKDQSLAVWQLPERLEIMADFPRGPGGKVIKSKLTEQVVAKMKAESAAGGGAR